MLQLWSVENRVWPATFVMWIAPTEARATTRRACVNATRDTTVTTAGCSLSSQSSWLFGLEPGHPYLNERVTARLEKDTVENSKRRTRNTTILGEIEPEGSKKFPGRGENERRQRC